MKLRILWLALTFFILEAVVLPTFLFNWGLNLGALLILTLAFFDKHFEQKLGLAVAIALWFDLWSGAVFGTFSLSVFLVLLLMHWAKKSFLFSENNFLSWVWIFVFYQLFLFLFSLFQKNSSHFSFLSSFVHNLINPVAVIYNFAAVIAVAQIYKFYVQKRVSRF